MASSPLGTNRSNPQTKPRRVTLKAVGAVLAAAALVAAVAVGVWLATTWEATPEPTSSVGTSEALRGWLALAAVLGTAVATGCLAWFARRVPGGVSSLLKRLDLAEEAHRDAEEARLRVEEARRGVEEERDALVRRLSLPYLYGHALRPRDFVAASEGADVRVGKPEMGELIAPYLYIGLPHGRLPQEVRLSKEECRELYAEIEQAEQGDAQIAVLYFANVVLVATVNDPHDDETGGEISLFPNASRAGPTVASGLLHRWPPFREAVRQVATHRLPSLTEYKQRQAEDEDS